MFTRYRRAVPSTSTVVVSSGDVCSTVVIPSDDNSHPTDCNNISVSISAVAVDDNSGGGILTTEVTDESVSSVDQHIVINRPSTIDSPPFEIVDPAPDTPTITKIILSTLDGVQCGVPTLTTPTLTPTTLRNIQQTFLQASSSQFQPPETHSNQAGFVPPFVHPQPGSTFISIDSKSLGGGIATIVDTSTLPQADSTATIIPSKELLTSTSSGVNGPPPPLLPISGLLSTVSSTSSLRASSVAAYTTTSVVNYPSASSSPMPSLALSSDSDTMGSIDVPPTRRMGGRRPFNDEKLSEEEEEKRRIRRERNKMAAARCRKRRLDQTMTLQEETDQLEAKKSDLKTEIQVLQQQKDELEFLLTVHKANCTRTGRGNKAGASAPSSVIITTCSDQTLLSQPTVPLTIPSSNYNKLSSSIIVKQERPPSVQVKQESFSDSEDSSCQSYTTTTIIPSSSNVSLSSRVSVLPSSSTFLPKPSSLANTTVFFKDRGVTVTKPNRPTTLNVAPLNDIGVSIETPSTGIRGLNFESMMEGGTGLTPVTPLAASMASLGATGLTPLTTPIMAHPSASSSSITVTTNSNCAQQLSSSSDMSSPDSMSSKQLVSL